MRAVLAVLLAASTLPALAQTTVRPHVRSDGTYVQGHVRSAPNGNPYDNYGTKGNINPYTGQAGTQNPYGGTGPYSPYGK